MSANYQEDNTADDLSGACQITRERYDIKPFTMVIFGGSGDLSRRKLLPTLFHLCHDQNLPEKFSIISFASTERSEEDYRELVKASLEEFGDESLESACWDKFSRNLHYVSGRFDHEKGYRDLAEQINKVSFGSEANIIYYLAVPPSFLPDIMQYISICTEQTGKADTRIIIEKPFGRDQATAASLNTMISEVFDESQIYRIDHYLGKETVQNILYFRFANSIFEPLWNRSYIDHIQITVSETIGIENRGKFYEQSGVIRDIMQNHMMQLLALVAMEPPAGMAANHIRDEKVKVYRSIREMNDEYIDQNTVRGQYAATRSGETRLSGYLDEKDTAADSITPTFFAGKLYIDNWRWAGVPFYLRSGKRLQKRLTEISIHFKQPPLRLFSSTCEIREPNVLVLGVQPREHISLHIGVKHPGIGNQLYPVNMNFDYLDDLKGDIHYPMAYERLLLDCMKGDQTLFARQDGIEATWKVVDPIIQRWESTPSAALAKYPSGSWGPDQSSELLQRDGRVWRKGYRT
ncbi:MAG: glucose-6-phosphate dehydrogenase [Nitrospira sp.]|nr:glucose-6-phosphate dehydrogenase [bacterium]MBL7048298.1 glucose-6-phosphate dehydrogenase [Nitrospira sp.]